MISIGQLIETVKDQKTNPMGLYQFGQLLSVVAVLLAAVQEYYNASIVAAYYVRSWCGGAGVSEIVNSSLLHGTTCIYSGGDGYWLAAPWEYALRTQNTFGIETGLSLNHWFILAGVVAYFVYAVLIIQLRQEYILGELEDQQRRFYYYHEEGEEEE
tara:strand:+ start:321 stop:791 length:471 start_codon:yes stop_codon:yes gene_type:complete